MNLALGNELKEMEPKVHLFVHLATHFHTRHSEYVSTLEEPRIMNRVERIDTVCKDQAPLNPSPVAAGKSHWPDGHIHLSILHQRSPPLCPWFAMSFKSEASRDEGSRLLKG